MGLVLFGRGPKLANDIVKHWRSSLMGGAMSAGANAISSWAMTKARVALVSATRETSMLFANLLGVWLSRKRLSINECLAPRQVSV